MTDALARQSIQRWTGQLVPPEYLGAHVSAPFSHQTGRYMPLHLRCATALFGHFGIEWDITKAGPESLVELSDRAALYKRYRALIHPGRVTRIDTPDDTAWMFGVVAPDSSAALMCYAQLDEPRSDQPAAMGVPRLHPARCYRLADVTPGDRQPRRAGIEMARMPAVEVSGAALAEIGLAVPVHRKLSAAVIDITAI
jgi:alpha-galactosidase